MTLIVPNMQEPFVDSRGILKRPWNSFLQQFTDTPSGVMSAVVTVSPFVYVAGEPGTLYISNGMVSVVNLIRGDVIINVGTLRAIVVCRADKVSITYSVLPTVQFVPFYSTPR